MFSARSPALSSRAFSFAIRFSSSDAGSSFGSCGTSLPRTARLRMVWRSCLIWSGRVVRAGSVSSAKRASSWKVVGIGRVEAGEARRRQPVARRLPLRPRRLQPVAQRHQLIDLGDDAVLFGERWEGKAAKLRLTYVSRSIFVPWPTLDHWRTQVCRWKASSQEAEHSLSQKWPRWQRSRCVE